MQPESSDGSPLLDPFDARCLPVELQEHLLSLLEARSLFACRCVSRSWRQCVDSSRVWLQLARGLGLELKPRTSLMQRVALLTAGNCSVTCARVEVGEDTGALVDCEHVVRVSFDCDSAQLKLLIHHPRLNRVRLAHVTVHIVSTGSREQRSNCASGRRYAVMQFDSQTIALVSLIGISDSTSPLMLLDRTAANVDVYPCNCSQIRVLCSIDNRVVMWSMSPVGPGEMPPHMPEPHASLRFDRRLNRLYPIECASNSSQSAAQFLVAVEPWQSVTLLRVDCCQLQKLRRLLGPDQSGHYVFGCPVGSTFLVLEQLQHKGQNNDKIDEFAHGHIRVARLWMPESGTVSSHDCVYELRRRCLKELIFIIVYPSNFLLFWSAGQEKSSEVSVSVYRYGIRQPLLHFPLPKSSGHLPRDALRANFFLPVNNWPCCLDPCGANTPLFMTAPQENEFQSWMWGLSFQPIHCGLQR